MVDPHRKINNLTEDHRSFLAECEEEFTNRYTEEDVEYVEHSNRKPSLAPIVDPWEGSQKRNYDNNRGRGRGNFNRHRGGGRYNDNREGYDRPRHYNNDNRNRGGHDQDRRHNDRQAYYGQRYNPY